MKLPKDVQRKLDKLAALESGGVDNWDGYDFALEDYHKENEKQEQAECFIDELITIICTECSIDQPAGSGAGYAIYDTNEKLMDYVLSQVKEFNNDTE